MSGTVRENAVGLRARLDERRSGSGLLELSGELFAMADLIGSDAQLRMALSDSGQPTRARVGLVETLCSGRVSAATVEVLSDIVSQRWSDPVALVDATEELGTQAAFMSAEQAGDLDAVEAQLFTFEQAVSGSADLQMALTNPSVGPDQKAGLIGSLLSDRAAPQTIEVLSYAMAHLRGRRVDTVMDELIDLAGEQRNRSVAEVRVARPLDDDQATRLAAALSRLNGRQVQLNVAVDPDVIGGISVRIGSEVVDATVAHRIEQARRAMVG
jgi:F-type H+-transporting ATPase subunit delta